MHVSLTALSLIVGGGVLLKLVVDTVANNIVSYPVTFLNKLSALSDDKMSWFGVVLGIWRN